MLYYFRCLKDVLTKLNRILTTAQKKLSVFLIFLTLIGAVLEMLGVSVIVPLVSAMLSSEELMKNVYVQKIMSSLNMTTSNQLILLMGVFVVVVYILKNAYLIGLSYFRAKYASKVQRELSVRMMRSYMLREYSFFLDVNTSELQRGMNTDVAGVYQILYQGFRLIAEGVTVAGVCIFIMATDIVLSVSVIAVTGTMLLIVLMLFKNRMKKLGILYRDSSRVVNKWVYQSFQGIKEIIASQRRSYFYNHYENAYIEMQKANVGQVVSAESPAYIIEGACVSGLILVVCLRIMGADNPVAYVPQLAAFAVATFRILPSLGRISSSFNQLIYYCPSLNATYNNLEEVDAYDEKQVLRENAGWEQCRKQSFTSDIQLKDVCWKYNKAQTDVIHNLNLEIKKSQSIALIGASGAGKSTLADIILGLLRPQSGEITVDGIYINSIEKDWSRLIGYVPQSVYLIDDTIRNNIAFGIEPEEIDDSQIWKTLEQAQMSAFVKDLQDGLDTIVGERGIKFSGGQRQRLALARALYFNPEILILDEATSALDTDTETAVMESIESLRGQKTLIIIAHRLTTIAKCDVIYEIVDGKAVVRRKEDVLRKEG